ncbi:MAG: SEC-C domain-containing protein [Bryobacterales bacterium]|nr:SEC-C domain-containing protein [Bryobacterales bacterium]
MSSPTKGRDTLVLFHFSGKDFYHAESTWTDKPSRQGRVVAQCHASWSRLQRLQLLQDVHFGEEHAVSALHDLPLYQRVAKRNGPTPQPAASLTKEPAKNPQPLSNQQSAKRNPAPRPTVGRNSPCPCGSGKKYKRCCGVNAPPILYAA